MRNENVLMIFIFFFQAEDGIRDFHVTGVQTCALPISQQPLASSRLARTASVAAGPTLILAASLAMLVWSWGTWPDVLIDFGRELYVPWQLSAGKVLYTDVAYFNGPLSPYFNSLCF